MKVTYIERIESRTAFNRNNYCPSCGGHGYEIVEQLKPLTRYPWRIRCEQCGCESYPALTREIAFIEWQLGEYPDKCLIV